MPDVYKRQTLRGLRATRPSRFRRGWSGGPRRAAERLFPERARIQTVKSVTRGGFEYGSPECNRSRAASAEGSQALRISPACSRRRKKGKFPAGSAAGWLCPSGKAGVRQGCRLLFYTIFYINYKNIYVIYKLNYLTLPILNKNY